MRDKRFRIGLASLAIASTALAGDYCMYVGTFTNKQSKGIYAWRFDPGTAKLSALGLVAETASPSFLVVHPNRRFLYAVNEIANYKGEKAGSVSAFAIDHVSGKLTLLNTVSTRGPGPCHLTLDKNGRCLIVANYSGGSVASFPVGKDGRLGEAASFIQHSGKVALPERQGGPHAHCVQIQRDSAFVADLGLDEVLVYHLNPAKATLEHPQVIKLRAGAGPRHLAFHPNRIATYVINEINSTITVLGSNLREIQTVSTLPKDFQGSNTTAEIAVHPNGKFVYGSNRGHASIAVFAVDSSGKLSLVEHVSTQGKVPRSFAIDPSGSYLFAANQNSDNIVLFRIDRATGRLTPAGQVLDAPTPVCITFVPVK